MKKFLLGLFLMLGMFSFALELDKDKLQKNNYQVSSQAGQIITLRKIDGDEVITTFYILANKGQDAKEVSKMVLYTIPKTQQLISSEETEKAYVTKFKDTENDGFSYSFVGKKPKVEDWYISVLYITKKDLDKNEMNKVINDLLNEAESFLK